MVAITKKVTLPTAIKRRNKDVKEITLSEPTITALTGLEITGVIRGDTAQLVTLLPRISDLTESEARNLSFKNIAKLSMSVTSFLSS